MKAPIARALAWDAFYQVLDNWVFRILAVLTLVPILVTFVFGFREEGIVLLFGIRTWDYRQLLDVFGAGAGGAAGIEDKQGHLIEVVLQIVFDFLAGSLGMLFCIAATSFFVPRMLEKGAAEVLFHKPASRWTLYLSRYFAGLLFIGILSTLMVTGMYLGLLLVSGHHDPAILIAAPTLTYVFALVFAVSMLIGVVTRSTVAATLLTSLFFLCNGCIHQSWISQRLFAAVRSGEEPQEREAEEGAGLAQEQASPGAPAEPAEVPEPDQGRSEELSGLRSFLLATLDVLHFVLPKTSDADYIARKLRAAVDTPFYREEGSLVSIYRLPEGTEERPLAALEKSGIGPSLREALGEARLLLAASEEPGTSYSLWRRPLEKSETRIGSRTRTRRETTSQAAASLAERLEADPAVRRVERKSMRFGSSHRGSPASASLVRWTEDSPSGTGTREAVLFRGADSDRLYTWLFQAEGDVSPELMEELRRPIDLASGIDSALRQDWYQRQLRLRAPLRYNILFSIGSSLAFTGLMLLLGWWKLCRIEF